MFEGLDREPVHTVVDGRPLAVRLEHAMKKYRKAIEQRLGAPEYLPVHPDEFQRLLAAGAIDESGRIL